MKKIRVFLSENFQFLEVKFSIYLNRLVFVMDGEGFFVNKNCFKPLPSPHPNPTATYPNRYSTDIQRWFLYCRSSKTALNPPMVYSTDNSKAAVPMLVLLIVALWFILRGDLL